MMNVYELTSEIDKFLKEDEQLPWGTKQVYLDMASSMIKEQAKRIEELEGRKGWFEVNKDGYVNHKPVAWMSPDGKVSTTEGKLFHIPLYTHPHKELSDEEILEIMIDKGICGRLKDGTLCYWQADADLHDFARAILKKAREK